MTGPLTTTQPFPEARALPPGYDRHRPQVADERAAVARLVAGTDWAGSSWPEVVEGLLALGRTDIPLARLGEGHVDALRILDEDVAYLDGLEQGARPGADHGRVEVCGVRSRGRRPTAAAIGMPTLITLTLVVSRHLP